MILTFLCEYSVVAVVRLTLVRVRRLYRFDLSHCSLGHHHPGVGWVTQSCIVCLQFKLCSQHWSQSQIVSPVSGVDQMQALVHLEPPAEAG